MRVHYKHPDEPDVLPPPDAFVIAAPWRNAPLARHPVFERSVSALREWA